jgi:hypothetical protein
VNCPLALLDLSGDGIISYLTRKYSGNVDVKKWSQLLRSQFLILLRLMHMIRGIRRILLTVTGADQSTSQASGFAGISTKSGENGREIHRQDGNRDLWEDRIETLDICDAAEEDEHPSPTVSMPAERCFIA